MHKIIFILSVFYFFNSQNVQAFVPDPKGAGGFPAPKWDCIQYVYDFEFKHYANYSPRQRDNVASGNAIKACSTGEERGCIEHLYKRYQQIRPVGDNYSYFQRAIKGCQGPFSPECLKTAESMLSKFSEPLKALEDAINLCRFDVRASCLEYAFQNEVLYKPSEYAAVNQAGQVCKTGVSKNCLALLNEKMLVSIHPDEHTRWNNAVNGCRIRP